MRISKEFRFEASHVLPRHPGKCARLHGHSWRLVVMIAGLTHPMTGFVMDFFDLKTIVDRYVIDRVDHQHLGAGHAWLNFDYRDYAMEATFGDAFYPTSENLVLQFAKLLEPVIVDKTHGQVHLVELELNETCTSAAIWRPTSA